MFNLADGLSPVEATIFGFAAFNLLISCSYGLYAVIQKFAASSK